MLRHRSELDTLEQSRVALDNATENEKIATLLSEVGIGGKQIKTGKTYLQEATDAYNSNIKETKEALIAHDKFEEALTTLSTIYRSHRKKCKVLFRENYELMLKLDLANAMPKAYLNLMQSIELFYNELNTNEPAKKDLLGLKVTEDEISKANTLVSEVRTLRKSYLDEKGESQSATKIKDEALKKLDKWMRDFFAVAKIALEDDPQLLESLGKQVKS